MHDINVTKLVDTRLLTLLFSQVFFFSTNLVITTVYNH